eukprot:jgi/Bigna1/68286/fgenesh1_pg.5_\
MGEISTNSRLLGEKDKKRSRSRSKERKRKKKRESKWDKPGAGAAASQLAPSIPATIPGLPGGVNAMGLQNTTRNLMLGLQMSAAPGISMTKMQAPQVNRSLNLESLREQLREVNKKKEEGFKEKPLEERSPSPPPVYNEAGTRLNTRKQRFEDEVEAKRVEIMEELLKHTIFRLPVLHTVRIGLIKKTLEKRIFIPYDKYPDYNFPGVIIGPRGVAQKRMEAESGCSISLRGQGTRKRKDGKYTPGDELPQHQCPQRTRFSANVKCAICGLNTHVAKDCPMAGNNGQMIPDKSLQEELGRYMAEISGDLGLGSKVIALRQSSEMAEANRLTRISPQSQTSLLLAL